MTDAPGVLEPPHRNGNTPHPPEPRGGRPPWEFLILGLLIALVAVSYILFNLIVDVLYGIVDPRVRSHRGG